MIRRGRPVVYMKCSTRTSFTTTACLYNSFRTCNITVYKDSSMATLLAPKSIEFKHYAGPPVSISRGQKARQADCAQDPSWDVQVIDLTTQEASEGIADMLKEGYLLISTSNLNGYQRRRQRQFPLRSWR